MEMLRKKEAGAPKRVNSWSTARFWLEAKAEKRMEKRIRVSTQGRLTIPKVIRDYLRIEDGQPIIIKTVQGRRELMIELMATMTDYTAAA